MKSIVLKIGAALLVLFAPIKATLVTVMVLTVVDLIAGILAAIKRKEKITSSGLKRTVVKILAYEIVVCLGYITEQYMTGDLVPVVKMLAGLIGITELKSVLENIEEITGIPVLQLLIDKLSQKEKE